MTSIRKHYEHFGPDVYYEKYGIDYNNPHEGKIRELLSYILPKWHIGGQKDLKILDLACGSGEVTRFLLEHGFKNISATDPYTAENYYRNTGIIANTYSFEDVAQGALDDERYDIVFCSYAMHLLDKSWLPALCYKLAMISSTLIILTPHKRPELPDRCGFILIDEVVINKARARLYLSEKDFEGV